MTRRVTRAALVLATAVGLPAIASTATASAATASTSTAGAWQTYRTTAWTDAPGAVCSFGVAATPVLDQEQYRTLASYPNGNPQLQEFRGPLYIRYTNTSTGASVERDLSGYARFHYGSDGSIDAFIASHISVTVHAGNVGFCRGSGWYPAGPG